MSMKIHSSVHAREEENLLSSSSLHFLRLNIEKSASLFATASHTPDGNWVSPTRANLGQYFHNNSTCNRNRSHKYFSNPSMESPHLKAVARTNYLVTQCCGLTPTPSWTGKIQHRGHTHNVNNVNIYDAFVMLSISI